MGFTEVRKYFLKSRNRRNFTHRTSYHTYYDIDAENVVLKSKKIDTSKKKIWHTLHFEDDDSKE